MAKLPRLPGIRFHPMDVELVMFYLKRKVLGKKSKVAVISEVDVYKYAPWDLPDKSCWRSGDLKWYFFCPRARKYSSGERMKRSTDLGHWKTTGKDRSVKYDGEVVGMIKTLVFHKGKAPKGERTDWVMYEYRLEDKKLTDSGVAQDTYVLCVIFKKDGPGPKNGAQYGAPFKEEDWDDDEEEEEEEEVENGGKAVSSAVTSPQSMALPPKSSTVTISYLNNAPVESSVDCPSETLPSACSPLAVVSVADTGVRAPLVAPNNNHIHAPLVAPNNNHIHAPLVADACEGLFSPQFGPDEDIFAMLAAFSEESAFILNGTELYEQGHNSCHGGSVETDPCLDGMNIHKDFSDLDNAAGPSKPQGNVHDQQPQYVMDQMHGGDNMQFLEMMDLDAPLSCSTEAGGFECIPNTSLCYNPEQIYHPANPCNAAGFSSEFTHSSVLPAVCDVFGGQINRLSEEDGVWANEFYAADSSTGNATNTAASSTGNATNLYASERGGKYALQEIGRGRIHHSW